VGQVYTTLQRLERDLFVESDDGEVPGPQKHFRITPAGSAELQAWLLTPSDTAPPRDELVIKVLVALGVPGVDVSELVQAHRRRLIELMQRYTRMKEDARPDDLALALVADAEIYRIDGVVRWLDSVDARVKRAGTPAAATPSESERADAPAVEEKARTGR